MASHVSSSILRNTFKIVLVGTTVVVVASAFSSAAVSSFALMNVHEITKLSVDHFG